MVVANTMEDFQKMLDSGKVRDFWKVLNIKYFSNGILRLTEFMPDINPFYKASHATGLYITPHFILFSIGFPKALQHYIISG